MNLERMRPWMLALALAGISLPAAAVQVSGLSGLEPVAVTAQPHVQDGRLHIVDSQGSRIVIAPWPNHLPQRFLQQQVKAERKLHPTGPADRIEFRHAGESESWMVLATGVRTAQPVLGNWRLAYEAGRWKLRNGSAWRSLRPAGRAAEIRVHGSVWCIYWLGAQTPAAATDGIAREQEARADIVAVREGTENVCPPHTIRKEASQIPLEHGVPSRVAR